MSKYYTPSIGEFHVGFEYEILLGSGVWEKHIFKPSKYNFCHRFKEETWFTEEKSSRVKYLDKEGIESFSFIISSFNNHKIIFKKHINLENLEDDQYFEYLLLGVLLNIENERCLNLIKCNPHTFENKEYLFQGKIKNKSEFKRLLKQLEIIKE